MAHCPKLLLARFAAGAAVVWRLLRLQRGVSPSKYTLDSRFVQDMGLD